MIQSLRETEVLIVGGGPAGLASAIALKQANFDVAVVDAAQPPIDKACGEGLMPEGVSALARLGITIATRDAASFRGIRFLEPGTLASACFPQGNGLGIRRTTLHRVLMERAASLGICLNWGARVTGLSGDVVRVDGRSIRCQWIIGADGQNSQIRQWAGLSAGARVERRFGFRRHFVVEPWSEFVDVHWSDYGQLYVSPVGAHEVCVAFITRDPRLRFKDVFMLFPEVAYRLTKPSSRELGAITGMRKLKSVCGSRCALVGEASGSVDAITGEGLSLAFEQALALAAAMKSDSLQTYERSHRQITRASRTMARLMLLMDRHPSLRRRVLRAFSAQPAQFERMLAVHTGSLRPSDFGVRETLSFGWKMLGVAAHRG